MCIINKHYDYFCLLSKPPALRILSLGTRGSGKTSHGEWLARQLGLFHVRFREQLQMLIMAKTKIRVPYADEVEPFDESLEDLATLIKKARGEAGEEEVEDTTANDMEVSINKPFLLQAFNHQTSF